MSLNVSYTLLRVSVCDRHHTETRLVNVVAAMWRDDGILDAHSSDYHLPNNDNACTSPPSIVSSSKTNLTVGNHRCHGYRNCWFCCFKSSKEMMKIMKIQSIVNLQLYYHLGRRWVNEGYVQRALPFVCYDLETNNFNVYYKCFHSTQSRKIRISMPYQYICDPSHIDEYLHKLCLI